LHRPFQSLKRASDLPDEELIASFEVNIRGFNLSSEQATFPTIEFGNDTLFEILVSISQASKRPSRRALFRSGRALLCEFQSLKRASDLPDCWHSQSIKSLARMF